MVGAEDVALCGIGKTGEVGEFDSDLEEGVPYITGIEGGGQGKAGQGKILFSKQ